MEILFKFPIKMNHIIRLFFLALFLIPAILLAQKSQDFEVNSPDGSITLHVEAGARLQWSIQHKGQPVIAPSVISLHLEGDEILGENPIIRSSDTEEFDATINAINYKK